MNEVNESAEPLNREHNASLSTTVIPLIQEELAVTKQLVATGSVRLTKIIHELPQIVDELLVAEEVEVERVPFDVIVEAPPPVRVEGDVTIVPVIEEVLVLTKQLRLKEELRITKRRTAIPFREEVTLLSEQLVVERSKSELANT